MLSNPYQAELDKMVWSFSRVNSYKSCPYGWKLHYLDHKSQEGSGFADWGSLCHSVFEDYANGTLEEYELLGAYDERYPQYMKNDYPPCRGLPLADRYYERGREIFSSFAGFPSNWEIIGSEIRVEVCIRGRKFLGYIDLLVRDQNDGKLIVVDHKSKGKFNSQEEQDEYAIQLYLYAYWVWTNYHEYPKELIFNMFRAGDAVHIAFQEEQMNKALDWFEDTINQIYSDVDFWDKIALKYEETGELLADFKKDDFFCNYLCGSRTHCPRSIFG